jgi:hypothetical protein
MRRKRAVRSPRRKSFCKTDLRRAIKTARDANLPVQRIDILPDGGLSIVVGDTGKADDTTNTNPWDEVLTDAAHEKRPA